MKAGCQYLEMKHSYGWVTPTLNMFNLYMILYTEQCCTWLVRNRAMFILPVTRLTLTAGGALLQQAATLAEVKVTQHAAWWSYGTFFFKLK